MVKTILNTRCSFKLNSTHTFTYNSWFSTCHSVERTSRHGWCEIDDVLTECGMLRLVDSYMRSDREYK